MKCSLIWAKIGSKVWDLESGECLRTLQGCGPLAVMPDGHRAVSGSKDDKTLKVWDLESGCELESFEGNAPLSCIEIASDGLTLTAWHAGRPIFLHLENGTPGPSIVVTAWQSFPQLLIPEPKPVLDKHWWQFWKRTVKPATAFGCPHCRRWSQIPQSALGSEIPCPRCNKPVRLNPFTIEGDWREVEKAWGTK
jgi:hypothetical protein